MKIIISIALLTFAILTGILLYDRYESKKVISENESMQIKQEALIDIYESTLRSSDQTELQIRNFKSAYGSDPWAEKHLQLLSSFIIDQSEETDISLDLESKYLQSQLALKSSRDTIRLLEKLNNDLFEEKEYIIDDFLVSKEKLSEELSKKEEVLVVLESKADSLHRRMVVTEKEKAEVKKFKGPTGVEITYFGPMEAGKPHGDGIGLYANGNKYEGEWREGKKHGRGKYTFPNGEYYDGKFIDDHREGYGQYFWPNGDVYVGFWLNDRRHGKGVIKDYTGKVISTGEWVNDALSKSGEVNF